MSVCVDVYGIARRLHHFSGGIPGTAIEFVASLTENDRNSLVTRFA